MDTGKIQQMLKDGHTVRATAEACGTTYARARTIANKMRDSKQLTPQIGARPKLNPRQREVVKKLLCEGFTQKRIAAQLGVSATTIANVGRSGESIKAHLYRSGVKLGRMPDIFIGIPKESLCKLHKVIPEGATAADWIRSLVVDALDDLV